VSAAEVILSGRVFEGDAAGAVEDVVVPIDNCAVGDGGIVVAEVLDAEAGGAMLRPVFSRDEGVCVSAVYLWLVDSYLDWDVFVVAGDDQPVRRRGKSVTMCPETHSLCLFMRASDLSQ
jgi:hypothetical protein